MEFNELLEKYKLLLVENNNLKQELNNLKAQHGLLEYKEILDEVLDNDQEIDITIQKPEDQTLHPVINNRSNSDDKIKLFMSLFRGRDDVCAKRWVSKEKGNTGYSPYCLNDWKKGVCIKPKGHCIDCNNLNSR